MQSNAAFAIGSLIWNTQTDLSSQYMTVLGALHPLFNPSGDGTRKENAQDNAAGAVARMILKNQAAVPLEQVLPIFLQALPLKRDWAESEWTFNAIFQLFQAQHPIILQNLDHILAVFGVALASVQTSFYPTDDAQLKETTRDRVVELLKAINASAPEKIAAAGERICTRRVLEVHFADPLLARYRPHRLRRIGPRRSRPLPCDCHSFRPLLATPLIYPFDRIRIPGTPTRAIVVLLSLVTTRAAKGAPRFLIAEERGSGSSVAVQALQVGWEMCGELQKCGMAYRNFTAHVWDPRSQIWPETRSARLARPPLPSSSSASFASAPSTRSSFGRARDALTEGYSFLSRYTTHE